LSILHTAKSIATESTEANITPKFTGSPPIGPSPCIPITPSIITRSGVETDNTSRSISAKSFLLMNFEWYLTFVRPGITPNIIFVARVIIIREWVLIFGREITLSASVTKSETGIFCNFFPLMIFTFLYFVL